MAVGQHGTGKGVLRPGEKVSVHDWEALTQAHLADLSAGRQGFVQARAAGWGQQGAHDEAELLIAAEGVERVPEECRHRLRLPRPVPKEIRVHGFLPLDALTSPRHAHRPTVLVVAA